MNYRYFAISRFQQSIETPTRFFETNADRVSQCSFAMAKRFVREGRLLVFGSGSSTSDVQHVSVEFVHPVIVGKRALPAIALTNDIGSVLGLAQSVGLDDVFAKQIQLMGTPDDIALGLAMDTNDAAVMRGLRAAHEMGALTIGMWGEAPPGGEMLQSPAVDFGFAVPSDDPYVIQEVQETTYHILWETVHVIIEHKGLM